MIVKTQGIVFHAFKYGESSLITEVYTRDFGLSRYIVSGVRSKKPRFSAGLFQVMTPLEVVVYHRADKSLNRLKEAGPALVLRQTPFDFRRGAVALFMAEVARQAIRESAPNEPLFDFLLEAIRYLDTTDHPLRLLPLFFLVRLSSFLGFEPGGDYSPETPFFDLQEGAFLPEPASHQYALAAELSDPLYQLLVSDWAHCHAVSCSREQARRLLDQLLQYYRLHLPAFRELRSPAILRQVLSA